MNQTAAAVGNSSSSVLADATSTFTTLHLVLLALLALLVIAGIVYGARLKHRRVAAEQAVEEHAIEAGVPPVEPGQSAADEPTPAPPAVTQADPFVAAAPVTSEPPAPAQPRPPAQVLPPVGDVASLTTAPEALADHAFTAAPASLAPTGPAHGPVTQLKGLGPKVAARLAELGVTTVGQVAALDDTAAASLDAQLGAFSGRMGRDRWIEQARFLAAGDRAGFEQVFGRL
jgi:predicted flap endonuclease-1-like 5' DNA nuclease